MDRVAHWVDQGAQPSDALKKLIRKGRAQAATPTGATPEAAKPEKAAKPAKPAKAKPAK